MPELLSHLRVALSERYRVEHELGHGGSATVYLATDLRHGRPVAVKVLRPEIAVSLGAERFLREIRIAAQLNHPHIVALYDSDSIGGLFYYIMPYVKGESLRERLKRERQLPVEDALVIATEVCDALSYAHEQHDIVHRDLKPENILLEAGHALVADFGLARAIAAAEVENLTQNGLVVGTPAYMSPEQAVAEKQIDQRSDVYSLGCVIYEMLTGELPFIGSSARAVMTQHSVAPVPSIRNLRPSIPAALDTAVAKALSKAPADRPQTARAFSQALTRSATAPLEVRRVASPAGAAVTAVTDSIVAAATEVGSWLRLHRRPSLVPTRVAVEVFKNESGNSSLDMVGAIATDWLADGLQRIEEIEVVPAKFSLSLGSSPSKSRELTESTGAGTIVSGVYYTRADSLVFHAQIIDVQSGRLLHSLGPVVGPEQQRMDIIDSLRQRVLGALAMHFGAPGHVADKGGTPPTFAAYQNYLAGVRAGNEFRYHDAIRHLEAAVAMDSEFLGAWFAKADVHYNLAGFTAASLGLGDPEVASQFAAGDFAWHLLETARDRMSPAQRHLLDWMDAQRRGDLGRALYAVRRMGAVAPDPATRTLQALCAIRTNRFQEATEVTETASLPDWGWAVSAEAFHMLADHRRELSEVRRVRQHHADQPLTVISELKALAALGRVQEVKNLLEDAFSRAPHSGWWNQGSLAAIMGLELHAHGHRKAAEELLRLSIDWYRMTLSAIDATRAHRYGLARSLYWAGQWHEARLLFVQLLAEAPSDLDYIGYLGVAAARDGDRAEALRISGQMAAFVRPYPLFGHPSLWRSRIAAVLGEHDEAVNLVREAISQGLMPLDVAQGFGYAMWLHCDSDFAALRQHPAFRVLVEPLRERSAHSGI
jgi:serine/threonine protein kinase/tetratricopeptide (TPR) repeat protein